MLKTKEHKLVEFLLSLDKIHVDELIEILTDEGKGRIALNSRVKDILLFEKNNALFYSKEVIELLITEFQLFAGNSVKNLYRSELVSYKEILDDVSNKIGSVPNELDLKNKEEFILRKVLGDDFDKMKFSERYDKSNRIKLFLNPSSTTSIGIGIATNIAINIASRLFFPAVVTTSAYSALSEAYRISTPFIIQIAWLKQKYGFYTSNTFLPLYRKTSIQKYYPQNGTITNNLDENSISTLNQLLSITPSVASSAELARGNYALININLNQLTAAKDADGLRGMVHGVKNGHFGITENVRIYEPETLNKIVNTGLLMNLASTIVAQKHLADISQKLDEIKEIVNDIKNFLNNNRTAEIESALDVASKIYYRLKSGISIPDTQIDILLSYIQPLQKNRFHLKSDLLSKSNEFAKIKSYDDFEKISKRVEERDYLYKEYESCINAELAIYAIFSILSGDKQHCKRVGEREYYFREMNELADDTRTFLENNSKSLLQNIELLHKKSESIMNFESTDLAYNAFFKNRCLNVLENNKLSVNKLERFNKNLLSPPLVNMALAIEDGRIVGAEVLSS